MRSEVEMLELIKETAREDPVILAAYMEGSRVNPSVLRDIFQDYDIVYIVETAKPYREDRNWIKRFGEILYMQFPEENAFYPTDVESCYGWLVQFTDGNRLDLHVCTREYALANLELYQIQCIARPGLTPGRAMRMRDWEEKTPVGRDHWARRGSRTMYGTEMNAVCNCRA